MSKTTPLIRPSHGSLGERTLRWLLSSILRASLLVSPRPAALLVRKVFAAGGAKTAEALDKHAPAGVVALVDERSGDEPDMLLDVFRPASAKGPLPLLIWVHGGGFCGGAKDELAGYLKLVASSGYVVVGPRYSLAPEHRYPVPPRQLMQALDYLQANAERLQIDVDRIAIAGDSAGAQIAAQLGALVTTPGYAETVGVAPTITVGNADPLRPHSELLADRLRAQGVETETLFFAEDRQPPLGHEYQFELDTAAGQRFLECLLTFLRHRLDASSQP